MDITFNIKGTTPLLMHNVRLADPLDEHTKALAEATANAKRLKTDAARIDAQRTEWYGGMYHSKDLGVYIPASWVLGALYNGGVAYGRKGTAVRQAVIMKDIDIPLLYSGPQDPEDLWADPQFRDVRAAGVQRNKVIRCRPKFPKWGVKAEALLDESALDFEVLEAIAAKAGVLSGMGDYRPATGGGPFGRFEVSIKKETER